MSEIVGLDKFVDRFSDVNFNIFDFATASWRTRAFGIVDVIYNDPATIVFWLDGTKTVVRCSENDEYDKTTGLLLCIAKKVYGNTGRFNEVLKTWVPAEEKEEKNENE